MKNLLKSIVEAKSVDSAEKLISINPSLRDLRLIIFNIDPRNEIVKKAANAILIKSQSIYMTN